MAARWPLLLCVHLLALLLCLCALLSTAEAAILKLGTPLPWRDSLPYLHYIRRHGVKQFIHKYQRCKAVECDELLWGDEIEYGVFAFDEHKGTYKLSLRTQEILEELRGKEQRQPQREESCTWQPEYGAWMIEGVPNKPYRGYVADLVRLERNLRLRRGRLHTALKPGEIAPSLTNFPLLGAQEHPDPLGPIANSRYLPDKIINSHPRFTTLTANIRARRGSNAEVIVPKWKHTRHEQHPPPPPPPSPQGGEACEHPDGDQQQANKGACPTPHVSSQYDDFIKMDSMGFGMGCCCIQITIQSDTEKQSRFVHDQLAVLSPIFMALSAATPIHRGFLADFDARWTVISQAVDDRTDAERGILNDEPRHTHLAGDGVRRLSKSRYSSISTYIAQCMDDNQKEVMNRLNDIACEVDEDLYQLLQDAGIDSQLSRHVAHLFVRDPLVVFKENIVLNDEEQDDHFQSIQSTNWRTVRWKPPDVHPSPQLKQDPILTAALAAAGPDPGKELKSKVVAGWRNEFRAMETQLTDFENAAYSVFLLLLTRALLAFGANLYLPLSQVDTNMDRAHAVDAIRTRKFFFRTDLFEGAADCPNPRTLENAVCRSRQEQNLAPPALMPSFREMSLDEIFNGSAEFVGLVNIVRAYINAIGFDQPQLTRVQEYLTLISKRAKGELPTAARWIRDSVTSHPLYKGDGVVSDGIIADLLKRCEEIGMGRETCTSLYGDVKMEPIVPEMSYEIPLSTVLPTEDNAQQPADSTIPSEHSEEEEKL